MNFLVFRSSPTETVITYRKLPCRRTNVYYAWL